MTNDEFTSLRENLNCHCEKVLFAKEKEYSDGYDRLVQFKQTATFLGSTPMSALAGMMIKHESSIHQMVREDKIISYDQWLEKIGDLRNYCDLLWAVVNEYSKETI